MGSVKRLEKMTMFFIHYASADLAWAEWIAWQLEKEGYQTNLDKWSGTNFIPKIKEAITKEQKFIIVLSPDYTSLMDRLSLKDKQAQYELTLSLAGDPQTKKNSILLLVFVGKCKIHDLLAARTYIDLVDLEESEAAKRLLEKVKHQKNKHTSIYQSLPLNLSNATCPAFPGRMQLLEKYTKIENHDNVVTEILKNNFKGFSKSIEWISKNDLKEDFLSNAGKGYVSKLEYQHKAMRIFGMSRPVPLRSIYTQVNILEKITSQNRATIEYLNKNFNRYEKSFGKKQTTIEGIRAINTLDKCIVLGKPGAGKTTFLKYILLQTLDNKLAHKYLPIFIGLKDWSDSNKSLIDFVVDQFNNFGLPDRVNFIKKILMTGKCLILLDGLDELSGNITIEYAISQIINFIDQYNENRFVISCRIAAYNYCFQNFTDIEIADFTDNQIQEFVNNWFKENITKAQLCWEKIEQNKSIKELATIPLLLTMLCLAFEENMDFPLSKSELYKDALDALLKKWDSSRNIKRGNPYCKLPIQHKERLFSRIAETTFNNNEYFFPKNTLVKYIADYIKNLTDFDEHALERDSEEILKSIEAQHGIFVERAKGIYSFSHLTFQEYFAAKFIAGKNTGKFLSSIVEKHLFDDGWREVFIILATMLEEADELLLAMKKEIDKSVDNALLDILLNVEAIVLKYKTDPQDKETSVTKNRIYTFAQLIERTTDIFVSNRDDLSTSQKLVATYQHTSSLTNAINIAQSLLFRLAQSIGQNSVTITDDLSQQARALEKVFNHALAKSIINYVKANQLLLDCLTSQCFLIPITRYTILDSIFAVPSTNLEELKNSFSVNTPKEPEANYNIGLKESFQKNENPLSLGNRSKSLQLPNSTALINTNNEKSSVTMKKITWLHLTDLHQGLHGQKWLYPVIREAFYEDLEKLHKKVAPIDLVLFTGDLTQGHKAIEQQKEQFSSLEETLQYLWKHLAKLGSHPKLLVVPGNHDLFRPDEDDFVVIALKSWHMEEKIRTTFWDKPNSPHRKLIEEAFTQYREWLTSTKIPLVSYNKGLLPGDFSATYEKDNIKLGIIGLNTAFLQLTKEDYEGKLDLHVQQLQPACSPDLPTWLDQHDMAILMTHHPTTWLSKEAQEHFNENIYTPGRFLFHAFGHMHEPNQVTVSSGGAKPKRQLQGASLFGLEKYKDTIQRVHGYSVGSLSIEDSQAILEIWPRVANKAQGGYYRFDRDTRFELNDDSGSYKEPFMVKKK